MHRHVLTRLSLLAAIVAAVAAGSLAGLAHGKPQPAVPSEIAVEKGHKLYLVGHAVGVQIYKCNAIPGGGYGWAFLAPRANVYGKKGALHDPLRRSDVAGDGREHGRGNAPERRHRRSELDPVAPALRLVGPRP